MRLFLLPIIRYYYYYCCNAGNALKTEILRALPRGRGNASPACRHASPYQLCTTIIIHCAVTREIKAQKRKNNRLIIIANNQSSDLRAPLNARHKKGGV